MQKVSYRTREAFGFVFGIEVEKGGFEITVRGPDGSTEKLSGPGRSPSSVWTPWVEAAQPRVITCGEIAEQSGDGDTEGDAEMKVAGRRDVRPEEQTDKWHGKGRTMIEGYVLPEGAYEYYMTHLRPAAGGPGYKIDCPVSGAQGCVQFKRRAPRWSARCKHCAKTHPPSDFVTEKQKVQFYSWWLHDETRPFGLCRNRQRP